MVKNQNTIFVLLIVPLFWHTWIAMRVISVQCCWTEFLVIQVLGEDDSMACQDLKSSLFQIPVQGSSSEVCPYGSGFY